MSLKFLFTIIVYFFIAHTVIADERTVVINDVPWPPYFFIGNEAEQLGIGKELLNYCLNKSGYKTKYVRLPIKRTHHYMDKGKIDITVYSYRQSREQILLYSTEPIFSSEYGFLVRADSDINIEKLADVKPLQIGHLAGLTYTPEYMKIIEEKRQQNQVTIGYSLNAMFLQLLSPVPRFDIMSDSKATFYWFAHYTGVSDQVKVLDYTLKNKDYFITVSKQSQNIKKPQALLQETDACIKQLKKDGGYQAILAKYGQ